MQTNTKQKRKRVLLTLESRLELIEKLNKGENFNEVAREFNIGKATIRSIYARKDDYINFAKNSDSFNAALRRKTFKKSSIHVLDTELYNWFKEQRNAGNSITKYSLVENACRLHKELGITDRFLASDSWINGFKGRHGIESFDKPGINNSNEYFEPSTSNRDNNSFKNVNFIKIEPSEEELENIEIYFESHDNIDIKYESNPEDSISNEFPQCDSSDYEEKPAPSCIGQPSCGRRSSCEARSSCDAQPSCEARSSCEEQPSCSTENVSEKKHKQLEQFSMFMINEIKSINSNNIIRKLKLDIMELVYKAQEEDDTCNTIQNN